MLVYGNKAINVPLDTILHRLCRDTRGKYFNKIIRRTDNIAVQCPNHKDGQESRPSCYIYIGDSSETEYGQVHCFTCGYTTSFSKMVAEVLDVDELSAIEYLLNNFSNLYVEENVELDEITFTQHNETQSLDFSVLNNYNYYHPYTDVRGITKEVVDRFWIGYDPLRDAITFPLWDENNRLVGITARSVRTKRFWIPENLKKPVYLLNFCLQDRVNTIYVAESQLNALRLWSWGYPAVAFIGTGTKYQYNILNNSGVRNFVTCFDGDDAGRKGEARFNKNIRKDSIVVNVKFPEGKDVCDLSKEIFEELLYKSLS